MLKKLFTWGVVLSTIVWAIGLAAFVPVAQAAVAGDLIKASGAAVYYYGTDGKRYVFPNETTFKSWYSDFSTVVTISDSELAAISIGGNVTMRPGTYLIKITTDPKVYAVEPGGVLRWIETEALAIELYGSSWATRVRDVSDAFFVNYTTGASVNTALHPVGTLVKYTGSEIYYIAAGPVKRLVADYLAFTANRFRDEFVVTTTISYSSGTNITGAEADLINPAGGAAATQAGTMSVSLASTTPASATVAKGATGVKVADFNFANLNGSPITLSSLTIVRTGLGANADIAKAYLYDGSAKLTSGKTFNASTNDAMFSNFNLSIPSGSTKVVSVLVDIAAGAVAGDLHQFTIQSVSAVGSTAASVTGTYPVVSNTLTIGSVAVGKVDVESNGSAYTRKVGEADVEVGNFTVYVNNTEDAQFEGITVYNAGRDVLTNLKLYRGSDLVATGVQSGMYYDFSLTTPYSILKGESATFTIKATIGGRNADTAVLDVRYNTDVRVKGKTYMANLQVDGTTGATANSYVEEADATPQSNTTTVQAGQLTASITGPTSADVAKNSNDVVLMNFTLTAQAALDVERATIKLSGNANLVAGDVDDLELVCNNVVVASTATPAVDALGVDDNGVGGIDDAAEGINAFTDVWSLVGGGAATSCVVRIDITNTATVGGNETIRATLRDLKAGPGTNWKFKDNGTGDTISDIVPSGDIAGNLMTVLPPSLDLDRASNPANGSVYVKGSKDVETAGFVFKAGTAADVKVTSVKLTAYLDNSTLTGWAAGDKDQTSGAADVISSVKIYDTAAPTVPLATAKSLTVGTTAITVTFDSLNWVIAKSQSKTLLVKVDLSTTAPKDFTVPGTPDDDDFAITIAAATDVVSEYGSGTALVPTLNSNNNTPTIEQRCTTSGVITSSLDANTPDANLIVAGAQGVSFTKVKFSATKEDFIIDKLRVARGGTGDQDFSAVILEYIDSIGATKTASGTLVGGLVDFSGLDIKVPKDGNTIITLKGNMQTTTGGAANGDGAALAFDPTVVATFRAIGQGSGTTLDGTGLVAAAGNMMLIYKSYPTVNFASDTPSGSFTAGNNTLVGKINITAGSGEDLVFPQGNNNGACAATEGCITIHLSQTAAVGASTMKITDGTNDLGTAATAGNANEDILFDFGTRALTVSAGTSKTLYVYYDTSTAGFLTTNSLQVSLLDDAVTNIQWFIYNTPALSGPFGNANYIFKGDKFGGSMFLP